jgi:hypothetical protein
MPSPRERHGLTTTGPLDSLRGTRRRGPVLRTSAPLPPGSPGSPS